MGKYTCEKCKKGFTIKQDYEKHLARKTPCIYQCPNCDRILSNNKFYKNHIEKTCPVIKKTNKVNCSNNTVSIGDNNTNTNVYINPVINNSPTINLYNFGEEIDLDKEELIRFIGSHMEMVEKFPDKYCIDDIICALQKYLWVMYPKTKKTIKITNTKSDYWEVMKDGEMVMQNKNDVVKETINNRKVEIVQTAKEAELFDDVVDRLEKLFTIEEKNMTLKQFKNYMNKECSILDDQEIINLYPKYVRRMEKSRLNTKRSEKKITRCVKDAYYEFIAKRKNPQQISEEESIENI